MQVEQQEARARATTRAAREIRGRGDSTPAFPSRSSELRHLSLSLLKFIFQWCIYLPLFSRLHAKLRMPNEREEEMKRSINTGRRRKCWFEWRFVSEEQGHPCHTSHSMTMDDRHPTHHFTRGRRSISLTNFYADAHRSLPLTLLYLIHVVILH